MMRQDLVVLNQFVEQAAKGEEGASGDIMLHVVATQNGERPPETMTPGALRMRRLEELS